MTDMTERDLRTEVDNEMASHADTARLLAEMAWALDALGRNPHDEVAAARARCLASKAMHHALMTGLIRAEHHASIHRWGEVTT